MALMAEIASLAGWMNKYLPNPRERCARVAQWSVANLLESLRARRRWGGAAFPTGTTILEKLEEMSRAA